VSFLDVRGILVVEAIYLALIVAVPTFLSPLIMAILVSRNMRKNKEQDWARQDAVAAQAAKAAELLRQNNQVVAETAAATRKQLSTIHALVNSTLTAAIQGRLDANKKGLSFLRRIIELNRAQNIEPDVATLAEIEVSEKEIVSLELDIADRLQQAKVAAQEG